MLWTGEEIGFITNGSVTKPFGANGISIDTRTLMPNELFIALAENRDGHDFIPVSYTHLTLPTKA